MVPERGIWPRPQLRKGPLPAILYEDDQLISVLAAEEPTFGSGTDVNAASASLSLLSSPMPRPTSTMPGGLLTQVTTLRVIPPALSESKEAAAALRDLRIKNSLSIKISVYPAHVRPS